MRVFQLHLMTIGESSMELLHDFLPFLPALFGKLILRFSASCFCSSSSSSQCFLASAFYSNRSLRASKSRWEVIANSSFNFLASTSANSVAVATRPSLSFTFSCSYMTSFLARRSVSIWLHISAKSANDYKQRISRFTKEKKKEKEKKRETKQTNNARDGKNTNLSLKIFGLHFGGHNDGPFDPMLVCLTAKQEGQGIKCKGIDPRETVRDQCRLPGSQAHLL